MDEEDSDFECYDKSDGKPVHADIDKEVTEVKYQHSHYYRIRQKTKLTKTVRQRWDGQSNSRISNRI